MNTIYDNFEEWDDNRVYLAEGLNLENPISRYTSLSNLLSILKGKFFVARRGSYSDICEKEGPPYNRSDIRIWDGRVECLKDRDKVNEYLRTKAPNLLVSCWTDKVYEDYLMWKSYTPGKYGVLIESTINNVIAALSKPSPRCFCGKISYYKTPTTNSSIYESLFYKQFYYSGEEEVRFYIEEPKGSSSTMFDIDPNMLINKIILSPFLSDEESQIMADRISLSFPNFKDKIKQSSIKIQ